MATLTASANVRGGAIDVSLAWTDPPGLPRSLRLVRRRFAYPTRPDDGLVLFDLIDLFTGDTPWARVDASRFLLVNNARAEGGVVQAELAEQYAGAADTQPKQVTLRLYDPTSAALETTVIPSTRVTSATAPGSGFAAVTTFTIYTQPGAGPEVAAGTVVVSTQPPSSSTTLVTDYTQPDPVTGVPPLITPTPIAGTSVLAWTPTTQTVTAATNATPIAVTTTSAHWLQSGATVTITGALGNTKANGTWTVFVTGPTTFTLTGSTGTGTYTGGASAVPDPTVVTFARQEARSTVSSLRRSSPLDVSFVTTLVGADGPVPTLKLAFTDAPNPDTGDIGRTIAVADREPPTRTDDGFDPGLRPGATYYYTAFEDTGGGLAAGTTWTASSIATGRFGFAEKLFALLPAVHRYYDDPGSGQGGSWQLRRFLEVFGPGLDQSRSLADGLASLHDVFAVRADYLPYLARLIGWEPDQTLPTARQRNDVLFAPEVYATVGTVPNIRAMVNRATGWDCQVKEFVNNVFLTNAPEQIRLWEIWEADTAGGAVFTPGARVTPTPDTYAAADSIDARPAVVADPAGGAPWIFWHSDRALTSGETPKRRIWMVRADGVSVPAVVVPDAGQVGDTNPTAVADQIAGVNVIRLFWSSTRDGRPNLWTLTLTSTSPGWSAGPTQQLTNHPAGDDFPAAVVQPAVGVWLFWQSSRRGPTTDIWAMTLAGGTWSPPQRITSATPRDLMPSAVIDGAGRLNLFWSGDQGDRSRICQMISTGSVWGARIDFSSSLPPATPPPATQRFRDEAPAAVVSGSSLWVFWHSDRDGIPRVYATRQTGGTWSAPFPVTAGRSAEKEPAPFAGAAGAMRLFFRTQRSGEIYRSRTVDMSRLDELKTDQVDDRWHYTYSTAGTPTAYYARDAVGLYMTPKDTGNNADHQSEIDRVQALVEPFRPVPARFVWFLEPAVAYETVYSPQADIGESYLDDYPFVETLGAVGDSATVTTGWVVLQTNNLADVTATPINMKYRVFFPPPT